MAAKEHKSMLRRNLEKVARNRLALIGIAMVTLVILACVGAPLLTDYDPKAIDYSAVLQAPNDAHRLGTDRLGRDVFSRILYGGQMSIFIGVVSTLAGAFIGVVMGGLAGYFGGKLDSVFVRFSEIMLTFPSMILILILVSMMGQGVWNLIIIFAVTGWMTPFRIIRGEFLSLREETFVEVSRFFGISDISIAFKQILPNAIGPIIAATPMNVASGILSEAGLSYLGVGVPAQTPTWGNILNAAKPIDVIASYWWLWVAPGVMICVFVLGVNFLGDGLRDVLDPKQ
ncbi:MAG: ABC transporter permease [Christensenellales bacterium]|nr:ABC transporter permease [Christensenellales bacterium]